MPRKKLPKMRMVEGSKRLVKVPGKTLDVTCTSGEQLMMTKKAARDFLGIKHHRTRYHGDRHLRHLSTPRLERFRCDLSG